MSRIRRILHASDFSRASGAAFKKAVEMAKANRAELLLVHVMTPVVPLVGDGYVSPKIYKEMEVSARAYAQKRLNALVAKAKQAGVRAKALLLEGVPHRLQYLRKSEAQEGRSMLRRTFIVAVIACVWLFAGCGHVERRVYAKPEVTETQRTQDHWECLRSAIDARDLERGLFLTIPVDRETFDKCMEARGYKGQRVR